MLSKTVTLVANTNTPIDLGETLDGFTVYNLGSSDVYVNVDKVATIEGDGSAIVPANSFRSIAQRGGTINMISSGTPKVELLGYHR